ncbi:MAG: hypothetical protein AB1507_05955 [Bacillota bacterium]
MTSDSAVSAGIWREPVLPRAAAETLHFQGGQQSGSRVGVA